MDYYKKLTQVAMSLLLALLFIYAIEKLFGLDDTKSSEELVRKLEIVVFALICAPYVLHKVFELSDVLRGGTVRREQHLGFRPIWQLLSGLFGSVAVLVGFLYLRPDTGIGTLVMVWACIPAFF